MAWARNVSCASVALAGVLVASLLAPRPALAEEVRFGEASAMALAELLFDKVRHLMVMPAGTNRGERAQIDADMEMIFRVQVIRCDGFLDELMQSGSIEGDIGREIRRIEDNQHISGWEKRHGVLSAFRSNMATLDQQAVRFAGAHFVSALATLRRGEWPINPPCISVYMSQVAAP
jgi:hypothetical protein